MLLVPVSAVPVGLDPRSMLIRLAAVGTVLPLASWTATLTVMVLPAGVFADGSSVKPSLAGGPAVTPNVVLVAPDSPADAAASL